MRCRPVLPGILALLACGCGGGEPHVQVSGTILQKGAPLQLKTGESLDIQLTYKGPSGEEKTVSGDVKDNGDFVVGDTGGGPPRSGDVTITFAFAVEGGDEPDFRKRFAAANDTFTYKLSDEPAQAIQIDLATGDVTRK